jgi:hypothetical protein
MLVHKLKQFLVLLNIVATDYVGWRGVRGDSHLGCPCCFTEARPQHFAPSLHALHAIPVDEKAGHLLPVLPAVLNDRCVESAVYTGDE